MCRRDRRLRAIGERFSPLRLELLPIASARPREVLAPNHSSPKGVYVVVRREAFRGQGGRGGVLPVRRRTRTAPTPASEAAAGPLNRYAGRGRLGAYRIGCEDECPGALRHIRAKRRWRERASRRVARGVAPLRRSIGELFGFWARATAATCPHELSRFTFPLQMA
jgi:hypothetical protein